MQGVMTPPDAQRSDAPLGEIERLLRCGDTRSGLQSHANYDFIAVGNAADDAALVVGERVSLGIGDTVVALRAAQSHAPESAAELDALDRRDREHKMRNDALRRIEEGFAQSDSRTRRAALHDAADRIVRRHSLGDHAREFVGIAFAAHLDKRRHETHVAQYLFRHDARGDQRQCLRPENMPPPLKSMPSPYLARAVKSACDGRGWVRNSS